eukprot:1213224-Pleurochrysis_carterae.AAC.2
MTRLMREAGSHAGRISMSYSHAGQARAPACKRARCGRTGMSAPPMEAVMCQPRPPESTLMPAGERPHVSRGQRVLCHHRVACVSRRGEKKELESKRE